MAIPRVDISQEIADWQAAVYGEEVRSANVSALTKLQTQMNAACDGIETAQTDVATAVNTANAASATANQASSDAQDAIDDAQAAITTAQGYAANAEGSAQAAAASATAAQTAQTNAQTAQLAAEAAEQAAEDAAQQAQIAINITPDEETIHHASDAVGTISAITYTLEEIAAMTDPSGKIPDASAVASLRESFTTYGYTSGTLLSDGAIAANGSVGVTAPSDGIIALRDLYTNENVSISSATGVPYVRLNINNALVWNTQGFVGKAIRASGVALPVKTGDAISIYSANMALTSHVLMFFPKG